ncbi:MAG: MerR family transcriptional regulator [Chloroflexi bacterium]|nr:MerR family transcriptional regulator [Chloroflexota bacterium]
MAHPRLYRIGQLARRCGVSQRTIDYYTDLGLLTPCQRTPGNYRLYADDAVEGLDLIRSLRAQGWPLAEIGELLAAAGGDLPAGQWARLQALVRTMQREQAALDRAAQRLRRLPSDGAWRERVERTARELVAHATVLSQTLASLAGEQPPPVI